MYTEYMYKDSLAHHGILGQKWGVRRFQNPDGTLTPEGRARYGPKDTDSSVTKRVKTDLSNMTNDQFMAKYRVSKKTYMKRVDKHGDPYKYAKNSKKYKLAKKIADASNSDEHPILKKNLEISKKMYIDPMIKRSKKKAAKEEYRKEKARLIAQWKKDASKYYDTDDEKYESAADKLTKDLDAARMKYDKAIGKKVTQSHYWNKLDDYSSSIVSKQKMPMPAGALIDGPTDEYRKFMDDFNRRHGVRY